MPEETNQTEETSNEVEAVTCENAIQDLSMAICKLNYAVTLLPGSKEQRQVLAEANELAEPYTPQLEDNQDDAA